MYAWINTCIFPNLQLEPSVSKFCLFIGLNFSGARKIWCCYNIGPKVLYCSLGRVVGKGVSGYLAEHGERSWTKEEGQLEMFLAIDPLKNFKPKILLVLKKILTPFAVMCMTCEIIKFGNLFLFWKKPFCKNNFLYFLIFCSIKKVSELKIIISQ